MVYYLDMKRFFLVVVTCSLGFLSCSPRDESLDPEVISVVLAETVEVWESPPESPVPVDPVPELPPIPEPEPMPQPEPELLPEPPPQPEPLPPPEPEPEPLQEPLPEPELLPQPEPEPEPLPQPEPEPEPQPEPVVENMGFDYAHITEEVQNITRIDVQQLIDKLNGIIKSGDYRAWVENLGDSYLSRINSREFLDIVSQTPRLRSRGAPLKDAEDYFFSVVIPSRINERDRVDDIDIEFVPEEEKIFAFRLLPNGQRRRLYELKNVDGSWKIVN
jgi:hypothetical protein